MATTVPVELFSGNFPDAKIKKYFKGWSYLHTQGGKSKDS